MNFPNLNGSEKQIKWANDIREDILSKIQFRINRLNKSIKNLDPTKTDILEKRHSEISNLEVLQKYIEKHIISAKFYIEQREKSPIEIYEFLISSKIIK